MAAQPEKSASDDQRGAHELHQREAIVKHKSAAGIAAEEFDRAALNSVKDEIRADERPVTRRFAPSQTSMPKFRNSAADSYNCVG